MNADANIKIKYLEMIQNIINRMASNSFMLKGWTTTLVAGIFVLFDKRAECIFCFITGIPIIFFWILDAYYLSQERLYRKLYDKARKMEIKSPDDYSMDATLTKFHDKIKNWCCCAFSCSELCYYSPLMLVSILGWIISKFY